MLSVALFITTLDRVTKILADDKLILNLPIPVCKFFNLTLIHNKGAAFGMFSGLPDDIRRFLLVGVSTVFLLLVIYFILKEFSAHDKLAMTALGMILGGAVGNLYDRAKFDFVVDFLDFYVGRHHYPAFNIADSTICIGVFILISRSLIIQFSKK